MIRVSSNIQGLGGKIDELNCLLISKEVVNCCLPALCRPEVLLLQALLPRQILLHSDDHTTSRKSRLWIANATLLRVRVSRSACEALHEHLLSAVSLCCLWTGLAVW